MRPTCQYTRGSDGCQFENWLTPLAFFGHEGKTYCSFHAPLEATHLQSGRAKKGPTKDTLNDFNKLILAVIQNRSFLPFDNPTYSNVQVTKINRGLQRWLLPGQTNLRGVVFPGDILFKNVTLVAADFSYCIVDGEIAFNECEFQRNLRFEEASIQKSAYFQDCVFHDEVCFDKTECKGLEISFNGCKFEEAASFVGAQFSCNFHICCSQGDSARRSMPKIDLRDARVSGLACFRNRNIGEINLAGVTFAELPKFSGAEIAEGSLLSDANYVIGKDESLRDCVLLRQLAAQIGDRTAVDLFRGAGFRVMERNVATPRIARIALRLYGLASDYGNNFTRPLLAFVAVNATAALLYFSMPQSTLPGVPRARVLPALMFTLRQVVKPFDAIGSPGVLREAVVLIATMQSLLSLAILALFFHSLYRYFYNS